MLERLSPLLCVLVIALPIRVEGQNVDREFSASLRETQTEDSAIVASEVLRTRLDITGGYRVDRLEWSIANTTGMPNILSELTWDNVEIYQVSARASLEFPKHHFYLEGSGSVGWIIGGDNQDSDYAGNNRTFEFSRSNNDTSDGDVLDLSGAVGYMFSVGEDSDYPPYDVKLLVGYSYQEQNLNITDGFQTIPPQGSFPGLDSRYETEWNGPWVGFEIGQTRKKWPSLTFRFEYHWADYNAVADWNLRTDFQHPKSFAQDADGTGYIVSLDLRWKVGDRWDFLVNGNYQDWGTDSGNDRTFLANGSILDTQLNEVTWVSWAVNLGVRLSF